MGCGFSSHREVGDVGLLRKGHYEVVVNKKSLNAAGVTIDLNARWDKGWRLAHVFEQDGNTVMVFERRED